MCGWVHGGNFICHAAFSDSWLKLSKSESLHFFFFFIHQNIIDGVTWLNSTWVSPVKMAATISHYYLSFWFFLPSVCYIYIFRQNEIDLPILYREESLYETKKKCASWIKTSAAPVIIIIIVINCAVYYRSGYHICFCCLIISCFFVVIIGEVNRQLHRLFLFLPPLPLSKINP